MKLQKESHWMTPCARCLRLRCNTIVGCQGSFTLSVPLNFWDSSTLIVTFQVHWGEDLSPLVQVVEMHSQWQHLWTVKIHSSCWDSSADVVTAKVETRIDFREWDLSRSPTSFMFMMNYHPVAVSGYELLCMLLVYFSHLKRESNKISCIYN